MARFVRRVLLFPLLLGPVGSQVQWTPQIDFAPRSAHAMAFDSQRQRTVLFGGGTGRADLWEFDGANWSLRQTPVAPPGRGGHAMAYDSARGRIVLFGGVRHEGTTMTEFDDTWEWDGTVWVRHTPAARPSPRRYARMAFDAGRGRVLLFGGMSVSGSGGVGYYGDTWEWDGVNWTRRTPPSAPTPRAHHVLCHDPLRGRVVLFGGQVGLSGPPVQDTWEWDGVTWTQRTFPTGPVLMHGAGGWFDPGTARMLVLGRFEHQYGLSWMETWSYDGNAWTRLASGSPPVVSGVEAAFDAVRGRAVVLGDLADTWEFDGAQWIQVLGRQSPLRRYGVIPSLVHDQTRGVTVMVVNTGQVVDTWEEAGAGWTLRTGVGGPYITNGQSMAFDAVRGVTVLFGGQSPYGGNQTWEYDGNAWTQRTSPAQLPSFYGHSMVFDPVRGRTVVFGTTRTDAPGQTWEWDGTTWLLMAPANRPWGRRFAAATWHPVRQRVLMYGGGEGETTTSLFSDLWEWDGTDWTLLSASVPPGYRTHHQMVFDAARDRIVVHGGKAHRDFLRDTWEWDGTTWVQRATAAYPGLTIATGMVYRPATRTALLFGGVDYATWIYGPTFPAAARPFGTGCAGTAGVPQLAAAGLPWLGSSWRQVLTAVPAGTIAVFKLGSSNQSWFGFALPFDLSGIGMTGCRQLVSTEVTIAMPTGSGTAAFDLALPSNPALLGAVVFSQAFVVDQGANPLGGTLSNGVEVWVGGR